MRMLARAARGGDGSAARDNECVVCLDEKKTHMFTPCHHRCVCEGCADSIMGGTKECPMCRANVKGLLRVYG